MVDELVTTTPFTVLTTGKTTAVVEVPADVVVVPEAGLAVVVTTRTPLEVVVTIKTALVREMPEVVGEVVSDVAPVATAPATVREVSIVCTISDEDGSVAVESVKAEATNPPAVREVTTDDEVVLVAATTAVVGVVVVVGTEEEASIC
jgi:N-acetylglucosamine kinase-like BadF-type ATPase